jgi:hypothetical protein
MPSRAGGRAYIWAQVLAGLPTVPAPLLAAQADASLPERSWAIVDAKLRARARARAALQAELDTLGTCARLPWEGAYGGNLLMLCARVGSDGCVAGGAGRCGCGGPARGAHGRGPGQLDARARDTPLSRRVPPPF